MYQVNEEEIEDEDYFWVDGNYYYCGEEEVEDEDEDLIKDAYDMLGF